MAGTANSGGRNKKDPKLHVLRGTFRKDRHGDHESPAAPTGRPQMPKGLSPVARAEWTRMVDRLEAAGSLTIVDDAALYQYAKLFAETEAISTDNAEFRKLSRQLKKIAMDELEGAELVEAIGKIVLLQHDIAKQTGQLRQGHMAVRQYLVEFGMTPAARTRVKLTPQRTQKQSPLEALMQRSKS
jgi:phage terminase small subunit